MCGRYTLTIDKSTIKKRFGGRFYIAQAEYEPTYNAAPSQMLPIIRTYHQDRIELATWGFWPEEWQSSKRMRPQNNATPRDRGREADVRELIQRPPLHGARR